MYGYGSISTGLENRAAAVQSWSISILDWLQNEHNRRCSPGRNDKTCPQDRFDYQSAIEAAGLAIREKISQFADNHIDAPELVKMVSAEEMGRRIWTDMNDWMDLAKERFDYNSTLRERARREIRQKNARDRKRWQKMPRESRDRISKLSREMEEQKAKINAFYEANPDYTGAVMAGSGPMFGSEDGEVLVIPTG